jgi:multiple sugar transport system permease protein/putative aldouronate transport system permease protein
MTQVTLAQGRRPGPRASQRPVWEEKPTVAGQTGKGLILFVVVAAVGVPLYSIVLTSFSTQSAINRAGGLVLWPDGLTTAAYERIFSNSLIVHSIWVSVGITGIGTALSMVVSVMCAYGLSRSRSFGHKTILITLIITLFISGGIVPTFIVVSGLGGYGQYWSMVLPGAVSAFNILVLRAFFSNTSQDLIDAARIDGAGDWRIMTQIVLPTSKAVLAVVSLLYAVGYWSNFFSAVLYLPNPDMSPLQLVIYNYIYQGNSMPGTGVTNTGQYLGIQQVAPLSLQMAVVVLSFVPVVLVYPFVQKHFTKGVLLGAIKG